MIGVYIAAAVFVVAVAVAVWRIRADRKADVEAPAASGPGNVPAAWSAPLPPPPANAPRIRVAPGAMEVIREIAARQGFPASKAVLLVGIDPATGYQLDIGVHGEFDPSQYVRARGGEWMPVFALQQAARALDGLVIEHAHGGFIFGGALESAASDPGGVKLSHAKYAELDREMTAEFGPAKGPIADEVRRGGPAKFEFYLMKGDSRAALVVTTEPTLVVAAYTDELDCVVPLRFPRSFVRRYGLKPGKKLLTVNTYPQGNAPAPDLTPGKASYGRYGNFAPIIADFLTDDLERVRRRKAEIDDAEWRRAASLATEYLRRNPGRARDGRPGLSTVPA